MTDKMPNIEDLLELKPKIIIQTEHCRMEFDRILKPYEYVGLYQYLREKEKPNEPNS